MRKTVVACFIVIGLTVGVSALRATSIVVYNTGVDASGTPLADGLKDTHYVILPELSVFVVPQGVFPFPYWVADGPNSKWIAPPSDPAVADAPLGLYTDPPGTYTFETTFSLSGLIPSTAEIIGNWTTDNEGLRIVLNGVTVGSYTTPATAYSAFNNLFTINSGFVSGTNTLDFVVLNDAGTAGNPVGLRVELSGNADPEPGAVPEPATWGLVSLGLLGAGLLRRRSIVR